MSTIRDMLQSRKPFVSKERHDYNVLDNNVLFMGRCVVVVIGRNEREELKHTTLPSAREWALLLLPIKRLLLSETLSAEFLRRVYQKVDS